MKLDMDGMDSHRPYGNPKKKSIDKTQTDRHTEKPGVICTGMELEISIRFIFY
jgi:hypothetical protein